MTGRRELLKLTAAATLALPLSSWGTLRSMTSISAGHSWLEPLPKIVYDGRFSAGRKFAREAIRLSARVHEINGDITELWFHDFYSRWKQAAVAVAGQTAPGAIFCFEGLAWDHRMRVVFRIEHRCPRDGQIEHMVAVPAAMAPLVGELRTNGPEWPSRIANCVTQGPTRLSTSQAQAAKNTFRTPLPISETPDDEQRLLVSWTISLLVRAEPGLSLAASNGSGSAG